MTLALIGNGRHRSTGDLQELASIVNRSWVWFLCCSDAGADVPPVQE